MPFQSGHNEHAELETVTSGIPPWPKEADLAGRSHHPKDVDPAPLP
jgi:hypothetical protein